MDAVFISAFLGPFVVFAIIWFFVADDEPPLRSYRVPLPPELDPFHFSSFDPQSPPDLPPTTVHNGLIYPRCPADGRPLGSPIKLASPSDIDSAIARASAAQKASWHDSSFARRKRVLKTLQKHILAHQHEIVTACALDSGETLIDAYLGEILVTCEKIAWTLKHGEAALKPSRRPTNLLMAYKKNTVYYEPLGVVAACVSWNYPFHNLMGPIIAALFTGNAIVVKPSEETAWSSAYFLNIVRGALKACRESEELVQCMACLPDVADHLTSHPGISQITFIGSRDVAHKVCTSAAKALTPVTVELGGKDPAIVLDDCEQNLEEVASILMRGVFQSAGQNCVGIERVIALPKVHDKLVEIVLPKIKALKVGSVLLDSQRAAVSSQHSTSLPPDNRSPSTSTPPSTTTTTTTDMGSMISSRPIQNLTNLISTAVSSGATLHHGGHALSHPTYPHGSYFIPTLLSNVTPSMPMAQTELFAPVFLLMRASSVSDAILIANSTPYALGASVFGHSRTQIQQCVHGIQAGNVAVNDFGAFYATGMPFGGTKGSGYGRFGGEKGLRSLCNAKSVCEDAWWARLVGMRTRIPGALQYPIPDGGRGVEVCEGVIELGYGLTWEESLKGLWKVVKAVVFARTNGVKA